MIDRLGNDIVDLACTAGRSARFYQKFVAYTFHPNEQRHHKWLIRDPLMIWAVWSMKEAAYKASVKAGNRERYIPAHITIRSAEQHGARLRSFLDLAGQTIHAEADINHEYVYAQTVNNNITYEVINNRTSDYASISSELKRSATHGLSAHLGIDPDAVEVVKDKNGVPSFVRNKIPLEHDLSLTHDGRFAAYAFAS